MKKLVLVKQHITEIQEVQVEVECPDGTSDEEVIEQGKKLAESMEWETTYDNWETTGELVD